MAWNVLYLNVCMNVSTEVTRRKFLVYVCAMSGASSARGDRVRFAVSEIQRCCGPYLRSLRPRIGGPLLWRGAQGPDYFRLDTSEPDLLKSETYGIAGAQFFRDLGVTAHVDVGLAHIGTGCVEDAKLWGEPVSVWPVGEFVFTFRRDGRLIYDNDVTVHEANRRRGPLVENGKLDEALVAGKEIMFNCENNHFFAAPYSMSNDILTALAVP